MRMAGGGFGGFPPGMMMPPGAFGGNDDDDDGALFYNMYSAMSGGNRGSVPIPGRTNNNAQPISKAKPATRPQQPAKWSSPLNDVLSPQSPLFRPIARCLVENKGRLDLSDCDITDQDIKKLATLHIILEDNTLITPLGLLPLFSSPNLCPTMDALGLYGIRFGVEVAEAMASVQN